MSNLADLSSLDSMSGNETVKATSNHLRGLIKEELLEETPAFGEAFREVGENLRQQFSIASLRPYQVCQNYPLHISHQKLFSGASRGVPLAGVAIRDRSRQ